MPPNYQQLPGLIHTAVSRIPNSRRKVDDKRELALIVLQNAAQNQDELRTDIHHLTDKVDRLLRCAAPLDEPINAQYPPGKMPQKAMVIGADGSQILPSAHSLPFGLTNAAAIMMPIGSWSPDTIQKRTETEVFAEDVRINTTGVHLTEESIDLYRDVRERELLAETALNTPEIGPIFCLADGSPEIFGSRDARLSGQFKASLQNCTAAYEKMCAAGRYYAGYIVDLESELVVRLLEVAMTSKPDHKDIRKIHPLSGITDGMIFQFLMPGMRSSLFSLRTRATGAFSGSLSLNFFYVNVAVNGPPCISRVEFPRFMLDERERISELHAIVLDQCKIIPQTPFPYVLQQADELARVSDDDKAIIERQLIQEYLDIGLPVPDISPKLKGKRLT